LEQIRDAQVMRLIERIGEHYRTNISNRFIRPALLQLTLDKMTWTQIETLTEKFEQFRYQGLQLDELYRQVAAAAKFVSSARREVAPSLRQRLSGERTTGSDRVLRDMVVNAFSTNLTLLAELLGELYERLKEIDVTVTKNKLPVYQQSSEFDNIHDLLNG